MADTIRMTLALAIPMVSFVDMDDRKFSNLAIICPADSKILSGRS